MADPIDWVQAAARWFGYLAAFAVVGVLGFRWLILPRIAPVTPPLGGTLRRLGTIGSVVLLLALAARLLAQAHSFVDEGDTLNTGIVMAVLHSTWGRVWTVQLVAAGFVLAGFAIAIMRPIGFGIATMGMATVIAAAPFGGHAASLTQAGRYGVVFDALHFGAAAVWLGTLATMALVTFGNRGPTAPVARTVVERFSPIALTAGTIAIGLGLLIGYRYLGGVTPLWTSVYGRVLLLKLGALVGVAGLGAFNWRVVLPALKRSGNTSLLRRTAIIELGFGLILLAVTAVLVAVSPPEGH